MGVWFILYVFFLKIFLYFSSYCKQCFQESFYGTPGMDGLVKPYLTDDTGRLKFMQLHNRN